MMYSVHLTQDWSLEKIAPYSAALNAAMHKMQQRFPDDVSLAQMAKNIAGGKQQLWLIVDENEEFAAFVTTEIEVLKSGKKRVNLLELAGEGGAPIADMIEPIEAWAREIGAAEICPVGRVGWRKILARHGYKPAVIRYRKEL